MIPIFSSHYSIGKSILNLKTPEESDQLGSESVFKIAEENNLNEIFLLEDSLIGFPEALKNSELLGIKLRFGLLIKICEQQHKVAIFAKNTRGAKYLNTIYSEVNNGAPYIDEKKLKSIWRPEDLMLCVPFYDSFIFKNIMYFDSCTPDINSLNPIFFLENCNLPFDEVLRQKVDNYTKQYKLETQEVKSIYYKNKVDVKKLQTYKCICNRKFGKKTLSKPNLDHFGSNEFCFESYLDNLK